MLLSVLTLSHSLGDLGKMFKCGYLNLATYKTLTFPEVLGACSSSRFGRRSGCTDLDLGG